MKRFGTFAFFIIVILFLTAFFVDSVYGIDEEVVRIAVIDTGVSSIRM